MRVALADTDHAAILEASNQLLSLNVNANDILTCVTNVSNIAEVQAFKEAVVGRFGEVTREKWMGWVGKRRAIFKYRIKFLV